MKTFTSSHDMQDKRDEKHVNHPSKDLFISLLTPRHPKDIPSNKYKHLKRKHNEGEFYVNFTTPENKKYAVHGTHNLTQ